MDDKSKLKEVPVKVHRAICLELEKSICRISQILSKIVLARPKCKDATHALSSLHVALEKARQLIKLCSDSSKLCLAITADKILLRCQKLHSNMEVCLCQVQKEVPSFAAEICSIMVDVRSAKFSLDPDEVETGMVLRRLLRRDISPSNTFNNLEFEVIQVAALKLNLISSDSIFIEKKSIQEQLKKSHCQDKKSKKILKYFLYLLRKYDGLLVQQQHGSIEPPSSTESVQVKSQVFTSETSIPEPPEQFKCPISGSLMHDPVIISSGRTFERMWIQRWIDNGNTTCAITGTKLEDLSLVPNSAIKCLIFRWCRRYEITIPDPCLQSIPTLFLPSLNISHSSSMNSLGSRLRDLDCQTSNVSSCSSNMNCDAGFSDEKSQRFQQFVNACNVLNFVSSCDAPPSWASQCKAVYNLREQLEDNEGACHSTDSVCIAKPLINFLKNALDLGDVEAQRAGTELLLAIMSNNRDELLDLDEDDVVILAAFLDSDMAGKNLAVLEILSWQPKLKYLMVASGLLPLISGVLNTEVVESRVLALKILHNLSCNCSMESQSAYVKYIPKLIQFMGDPIIANSCIEIIKNLCDSEGGSSGVYKTSSCITEIAGFLVTGTRVQEYTADVLHSLCYEREEYIPLVVKENVVQPLVHMSKNGSYRGKVIAAELLQLLGHTSNGAYSEYSFSHPLVGFGGDVPSNSIICSKENKSVFKKLGFLQMKLPSFLKPINKLSCNSLASLP